MNRTQRTEQLFRHLAEDKAALQAEVARLQALAAPQLRYHREDVHATTQAQVALDAIHKELGKLSEPSRHVVRVIVEQKKLAAVFGDRSVAVHDTDFNGNPVERLALFTGNYGDWI